jgi:hypothetical protein
MAALSEGAERELLEETFGAGGTMEVRVNPLRDVSRAMSTGGAITLAGRFGALAVE